MLQVLSGMSNDLRYLACAKGVLQSTATHISDPCVPQALRSSFERVLCALLCPSSETSVETVTLVDRVPLLSFPPAVLSGEALSNADEAARLLAEASELGAPVSATRAMQLYVKFAVLFRSCVCCRAISPVVFQ
jgi:hypothetical protein